MRSKEIESFKKKLKLTSRQRSLLVGTLLGDGHLETLNNGQTYRLKIEHSIKQKEYVEWFKNQLKEFIRQPLKIRKRITNVSSGKEFGSISFTTYSLGLFRFYAQQFYVGKKKIIPKLIDKLLDPVALAVWFMDDGSFKSGRHKTYVIHTLGYKKDDLERIKKVLKKKFDIEIGLHKQYDKFRIYVYSKSANKFKKLISPYIISSLKYKLGNTKPKE